MLIIGISGVTNGGKTTIAKALHKALPNSHLMSQDTYFFPPEDERHIWIPEVNHINWEIMSSLDMDKMWLDISTIVKEDKLPAKSCHCSKATGNAPTIRSEDITNGVSYNHEIGVLIIEGFLVLNYQPIVDICHLKYHLTLEEAECRRRRDTRVYDPPDVPGFFDVCVWPEYVKHKAEMLSIANDVTVIDGANDIKAIFKNVLEEVVNKLNCMRDMEKK